MISKETMHRVAFPRLLHSPGAHAVSHSKIYGVNQTQSRLLVIVTWLSRVSLPVSRLMLEPWMLPEGFYLNSSLCFNYEGLIHHDIKMGQDGWPTI